MNYSSGHYPSNYHLVVLENCFLRCKMCYMWKSEKESEELPVSVWEDFISSLKVIVDEKAKIHFVGGEPLMKDSITDLVRFSSECGFKSSMTTNAFLIDRKKAKQIAESGLDTLVISLDSLNHETHDYLRGAKGAYQKAMEAVAYFDELSSTSPKIHINTTIMAININDLIDLVKWVDAHKRVSFISFQAVMQPFFTPIDNYWYKDCEFNFLWPKDIEQVNLIIDELIRLKRNGSRITNPILQLEAFKSYFLSPDSFIKKGACNLGYDSLTVNSHGDMFLCLEKEPLGNIRNDCIKDLWSSEKIIKIRQQIKTCRKNCKLMVNCFFEERRR